MLSVTVPDKKKCMHMYDQMCYPSITNVRLSALIVIIWATSLLNAAMTSRGKLGEFHTASMDTVIFCILLSNHM